MLNPSISASMGLSSINRAKQGMAILYAHSRWQPHSPLSLSPKPGEFPGQVLGAIAQATKQEVREPEAQWAAIRGGSRETEEQIFVPEVNYRRERGGQKTALLKEQRLRKHQ